MAIGSDDTSSIPPSVIVTTPIINDLPAPPTVTIQPSGMMESCNSSQSGTEVRQRRGRSFLRSVYNRLRIAAHISRDRRGDAAANADAVIDEVGLDEIKKFRRQESRLSTINQGVESRKSVHYDRQLSAPAYQNCHQQLAPVESVSTTRNYILGKGAIHFWRNFTFESEVMLISVFIFINFCSFLRDILS